MIKKTLWALALTTSLTLWNGAAITAAVWGQYNITNQKISEKLEMSPEKQNYEQLEKMIQPLITKKWPNQRNRVDFIEENWTETHIEVIKRGLKLSHNEELELKLININIEHKQYRSKINIIILKKWYEEVKSEYKVLLSTWFNWANPKENPIELSTEEFKTLIPKIKENIEQYISYKKSKKSWNIRDQLKIQYDQLKNAVDF